MVRHPKQAEAFRIHHRPKGEEEEKGEKGDLFFKTFCSNEFSIIFAACLRTRPDGGIGRRAGLKIQ